MTPPQGPATVGLEARVPREEALAHLSAILASEPFIRSERMRRFLEFIVLETLEGRAASLKEAVIGCRVFGRPPSYDPSADPVVRVEARRLRSKLDEFYRLPGAAQGVRVSLPKGAYAPVISLDAPAAGRTRRFLPRRRPAAAAVLAVAAAASCVMVAGRVRATPSRSVAVLPIADLTSNGRLRYFCEGLNEELVFALSRVPSLKVPGRAASLRFGTGSHDVRQIGRELGVQNVLEGSVRAEGALLRITVRLSSAESGYQVWARTYDREMGDVLALQEEIAAAVTNTMAPQFTPSSRPPNRRYSADREAVRLYFESKWYHLEGDFEKSVALLKEAIALDPGFALAWAQLARMYIRIESAQPVGSGRTFAQARAAAARANEIDEHLAEAALANAIIDTYQWNWMDAARSYERAIRLDPESAEAHGEYAIGYLVPANQLADAVREAALAAELNPTGLIERNRHGVLLLLSGKVEEARRELAEALKLAPESRAVRANLGRVYLESGNWSKALEEFRGNPLWTAITLARAGRKDEASRIELPQGIDIVGRAVYHAAMGEDAAAIELLRTAMAAKHQLLPQIGVDPSWRALQGDDRFRQLVADVTRPAPAALR